MRTFVATRTFLPVLAVVVVVCTAPNPAAQGTLAREFTVFVSAVDKEGEPVEGLGPEAFIVREEGARREVLRVSHANEPIDIAVLVDNSAAAQTTYSFVRTSLTKFVTAMTEGNQIAVIGLADRPTILTDYTRDRKRLTDTVGRIFPMSQSGMTLLDAINETSRGLRRREAPRAVMLAIVSDGAEFTNRYAKDAVKDLVDARVAFHVATIGQFNGTTSQSERERMFLLDQGPRASGGQRISLLSPMALDQALERLARELKGQYKVVYARPQSLIAPEKIEVASARPNVTMRGALSRGENGARR